MIIVHDLFILIPELAGGVKRTRKLLKRRVFLGQASTSQTRVDHARPRLTLTPAQ
jgi:hypothetical protein